MAERISSVRLTGGSILADDFGHLPKEDANRDVIIRTAPGGLAPLREQPTWVRERFKRNPDLKAYLASPDLAPSP